MEIRLDQIVEEPFEWRETPIVPIESLQRDELVALEGISWGGTVSPLASGHLFTAKLNYRQELECPRCLESGMSEVEAQVELLLTPGSKEPVVGELELGKEDLGVLYVSGEVLDTDPILFEQVLLNIPMRPLCREDCAGLCPTCGANRNHGNDGGNGSNGRAVKCHCETEPTDPRWAALAAFKDRAKDRLKD